MTTTSPMNCTSQSISETISPSSFMGLQLQTWRDIATEGKQQGVRKSLGPSYQLQPFDVICAKGNAAKEHTGNRRFQVLIDLNLDKYRSAGKSRTAKTSIVSEIIEIIRSSSPDGGFIQNLKGEWYQVSEHHAREKVGQSLRDRLHTSYKSSSKAKIQKRRGANKIVKKESKLEMIESPAESSSTESCVDASSNCLVSSCEKRTITNPPETACEMERQSSIIVSDSEGSDDDSYCFQQQTEDVIFSVNDFWSHLSASENLPLPSLAVTSIEATY